MLSTLYFAAGSSILMTKKIICLKSKCVVITLKSFYLAIYIKQFLMMGFRKNINFHNCVYLYRYPRFTSSWEFEDLLIKTY